MAKLMPVIVDIKSRKLKDPTAEYLKRTRRRAAEQKANPTAYAMKMKRAAIRASVK